MQVFFSETKYLVIVKLIIVLKTIIKQLYNVFQNLYCIYPKLTVKKMLKSFYNNRFFNKQDKITNKEDVEQLKQKLKIDELTKQTHCSFETVIIIFSFI